MPTVQENIWASILAGYSNDDLKGAIVVLAFKEPGQPHQIQFIKAFAGAVEATDVIGVLETLKHQVIGDSEVEEWKPGP